jgi:hypothetical protein
VLANRCVGSVLFSKKRYVASFKPAIIVPLRVPMVLSRYAMVATARPVHLNSAVPTSAFLT